ncbi:hypothetical protein FOL47_010366 [Perkinsus chesapeaki]|uniref:C3H1-type domain-containing protein n=1 Tax=Perkinsus chesapeaki TaxID=330153 RepID=A0A7J6N1L2_PERCH|nr:hypothetical protein FOL47_010366 [Perkinsus chesapeaki]
MSLPLSQLQQQQQLGSDGAQQMTFADLDGMNIMDQQQQAMMALGQQQQQAMGQQQAAPGTPGGGGVPHRELYRKTRMCKYFLQGYCVHGDQCDHAHDVSELRHLPDMRPGGYNHTGAGSRQVSDTAPTSPGSTVSHPSGTGAGEAGSHEREVFRKTRMCKYFQQGYCVHGSDCNYAHDWSEIRHVPDGRKNNNNNNKSNQFAGMVQNKDAASQFMNNAVGGGGYVPGATTDAAVLEALSSTAAALNQNPGLLVTGTDGYQQLPTTTGTGKAMSNTMTASDYLEQAQLLEQIAKALEQLNGSADTSAFTAGDEVRLRLRSYTGGQDMIAALVDDPPDNFPSITDSFPTVPAPGLDADAPAFVPQHQQQQQQATAAAAMSSGMNEKGHYTKSCAGTLLVPPTSEPSEPSQSRPRGLSGWKPLESTNVESRSRTLSQIATILEARRRLPSFNPQSTTSSGASSSQFGSTAVASPALGSFAEVPDAATNNNTAGDHPTA